MKNIINLFKKKSSYGDSVDSPEERVAAYIYHWHEQWSKAQRKMDNEVDFDYWGKLISEVDDAHFVAGSSSGSGNSFGSKS